MQNHDADQIVAALRLFDPNYKLISDIPVGEFILCIRRLQDEVEELRAHISSAEEEEAESQRERDKCIGAYGYDLDRLK